MNYSCPKCGVDIVLQTKKDSLRKPIVPLLFLTLDQINIDKCPACGTKVYKVPHPFDKIAQALLFIPILVFLVGLILGDGRVQIAGGIVFIFVILFIIRGVSKDSYKSWKYFRAS